MKRRKEISPEEEEAGLIEIGRIYQSTDTAASEVYVRVQCGNEITAYQFRNPVSFWVRVVKYADQAVIMEVDD